MNYRVSTYLTFRGLVEFVNMPDSTYGEWIIYDRMVPKYHINLFEKDDSNVFLRELISGKTETIENIINKINKRYRTNLSFGTRPVIEIVKKEELVNLELTPLPIDWIKNIN